MTIPTNQCPACHGDGPHFVPPSLGDAGFYLCEAQKRAQMQPTPDPFAGQECPNCGDAMRLLEQAPILVCSGDCGVWLTPNLLRAIRREGHYQSCLGFSCGAATPPRGWERCPFCGNVDRDNPTILDDWNHPDRAEERVSQSEARKALVGRGVGRSR